MITKIPNTIWEISPADLIRIHEQLLINLGEEMTCHHGEWSSWESELRKHIRRITAALNVMHTLVALPTRRRCSRSIAGQTS